jgi:hypothetical protein
MTGQPAPIYRKQTKSQFAHPAAWQCIDMKATGSFSFFFFLSLALLFFQARNLPIEQCEALFSCYVFIIYDSPRQS